MFELCRIRTNQVGIARVQMCVKSSNEEKMKSTLRPPRLLCDSVDRFVSSLGAAFQQNLLQIMEVICLVVQQQQNNHHRPKTLSSWEKLCQISKCCKIYQKEQKQN